MAESHRKEKVGAEIQKLIGNMLIRDIKDPRLDHMISVSACDISPDLSYAIVYISILDDRSRYSSANTRRQEELDAGSKEGQGAAAESQEGAGTDDISGISGVTSSYGNTELEEEVLAGFKSCEGMIRKKIGREIKLRRVPQLDFRIDRSEEYGSKMDEMLRNLR